MSIERLIYYSRNRVPGPPAAIGAEIESILAASRRNNVAVGVTGALMFNAGCFAQVLEGERAAIETTFERIQRDPRHGDVNVLEFGTVPARSFATWSMAFVGRSAAGEALFGGIGSGTGFDPKRIDGERIFAILRELLIEDERATA